MRDQDSVGEKAGRPGHTRPCREDEAQDIREIINEAAEAYRGRIPADCWHEPYMPEASLRAEMAAGVSFTGHETNGRLVGVMGIQPVGPVDLIRHAYVRRDLQGQGIGSVLISRLLIKTKRPVLVGTWAAASWAIRFYEQHGFMIVPGVARNLLLETYWSVPARQRQVSVVLAAPADEALAWRTPA